MEVAAKTGRYWLAVLLLISCSGLGAQDVLDREIQLKIDSTQLEDALFQVSEAADLAISFASGGEVLQRLVSLPLATRTLRETLALLLDNSGLEFRLSGRRIILTSRSPLRYTLSGFLGDAGNGERLVAGTIRTADNQRGTLTNSYGFFSLDLPAGDHLLYFSYLGYRTDSLRIKLQADIRKDVLLTAAADLPEIVVRAGESTASTAGSASPNPYTAALLQQQPGLGGEADLFNLVYQNTDSQRGADGLGGFFVRGGGADQNLVLLDDAPVFQPSHSFGIFSVINPAIVRSARFYQDGFSARYGGRLAAVLDVRGREGNTEKFAVEAEVGVIASKLKVEIPTAGHRGALLLAGRRSHLDPLLSAYTRRQKEKNEERGQTRYFFHDLNLKYHQSVTDKDRLYLSFYRGGDVYSDVTSYVAQEEENGAIIDYFDVTEQDLRWGNTIGSLRWNRLFNDHLFANLTLTYSRYRYRGDNFFETREAGSRDTIGQLFFGYFESVIRDGRLKVDVDYYRGRHHWRFGAEALSRRLFPGVIVDEFSIDTIRREDIVSSVTEEQNSPDIAAGQGAIYGEDRFSLNDQFTLSAGGRLSVARHRGRAFWAFEPRLSLLFQQRQGRWISRFSVDRMTQAIHLLTVTGQSLPTDLWVPATENYRPQSSWQWSLSNEWRPREKWTLEFGAYYRRLNHLLRYDDAINWPGLSERSTEFWEDEVIQGEGTAYGLNGGLRYHSGRTDLSGGYWFQRSLRTYEELNGGLAFPFSFDRPHKLVLNLRQQLSAKWHFTLHWEISSGRPLTLLETEQDYRPLENFLDFDFTQLTEINGFRLPAYHRLDLGLNWSWGGKSDVRRYLQLGVYNLYNRRNTYYAYELRDTSAGGDAEFRSVRSLPVFPSLSYRVSW